MIAFANNDYNVNSKDCYQSWRCADEIKDSAKVFNAVLYLASHAATFKWRARSVVRSSRQVEKKDPVKLVAEDADDVMTPDEESDFY